MGYDKEVELEIRIFLRRFDPAVHKGSRFAHAGGEGARTKQEIAQQIPHRPKKVYPIDASGKLPNGATFKDVHGLKKALMKEERTVASSVFEGLLCYALGRDVSFADREIIRTNLDDLSQPHGDGEKFAVREMIKRVVTSRPFRER